MGEAARIWTTVGANIAPLKAGLAEASTATNRFGSSFGSALARQTRTMEQFGRSWTRHVSAPLLLAGGVAAKMSLDFGRNMALISTSAGASARDVATLSAQVLKLAQSGRSPYGPNELAKALYHLKSLGYDNVTAMRTLRVAIDGALAGNSDLESTTSSLGAAIRTNIKGTGDFSKAMATLNATVGAGNMRMEDLIAALGTGVLPAAKSAGLSLKDVGAALALMVDEGMSAESAATRLRMAFTMMSSGSASSNKALGRIGLSTKQLGITMQGPGGLIAGLKLLRSHLDQLGGSEELAKWAKQVNAGKMSLEQFERLAAKTEQFDVISRAFGGARSGAAIEMLLNNLGVLGIKFDQIGKTTDKYRSKVQQARDLDMTKLKESWAQIDASLVKAGADITPFVVRAARGLAVLSGWFSNLHAGTRRWLLLAGGALAFGGPLLLFAAKLIRAVQTVKTLFVTEEIAAGAATAKVGEELAAQELAVNSFASTTSGRLTAAWGAEATAVTASTAVVEGEMAAQGAAVAAVGAKVGLLGKGLLALSALGTIAIALTFVPKSKKGQTALEREGMGALGRLPVLGGFFQQSGAAGLYLRGKIRGDGAQHSYSKEYQAFLDSLSPARRRKVIANANAGGMVHGDGPARDELGDFPEGKKILAARKAEEKRRAAREAARKKAEAAFDKLTGGYKYDATGFGGAGGGTSKTFALPMRLQLEAARAATTATRKDDIRSARDTIAYVKKQIDSGKLHGQKLLDALGIEGSAASELFTARKTTADAKKKRHATFTIPLALQAAQARADALAGLRTDPNGPTTLQMRIAGQVKAAAMRAINSHHLTMQALIDAWNVVSSANSTLVQKPGKDANNYVAVSTRSFTKGLGLTDDQAKQVRERAAQAAAHGGSRPAGPAVEGIVLHLHNPHFHGVRDVKTLYSELEKEGRKRGGQRVGQR